MGRALIVINGNVERERAAAWARKSPPGTRIEFKAAKRSLPQNDRMWAMLTDVSKQAKHNGVQYTPDQWKILFMHACGREVQFLPGLDGKTFLPWGQSSSDLSKQEMTDLIEFIFAWGAEHGVVFQEGLKADMEGRSTAVRAKATTIKQKLDECCGENPKVGTVQVRKYVAGLLGVDERELQA